MLNIFTDANTGNIGFIVYEGKKELYRDKDDSSNKDVAINELEAIKFALKYASKNHLYEDIYLFTDNTNAKKMVDSIVYEHCTVPDSDRLNKDDVSDLLEKIEKYIGKLGDIDVIYSPAHCETNKEVKKKFKKFNSDFTVNNYKELEKRKRKKFIKRMRKRNAEIDKYIKE
jgi:ribonuclease HI